VLGRDVGLFEVGGHPLTPCSRLEPGTPSQNKVIPPVGFERELNRMFFLVSGLFAFLVCTKAHALFPHLSNYPGLTTAVLQKMITPGQFSEGTKRLLQRHPALPAPKTRELAAAFTTAQSEVCRQLAALNYPLERVMLELQSGHLAYFREGSDRDRKRDSCKKVSYRFAGFAPSHTDEFACRRHEWSAGRVTEADFVSWEAGFLIGFTFEVIEQVARRVSPALPGRIAESGLDRALALARQMRDEILAGNLLLVAKVVFARARCYSGVLWDDLFAAGVDGLMIAINRYDPSVGHFSTYAMPWMKMAIDRFVAKTRNVIRIPIGMQEKVRRERRAASSEGETGKLACLIPEVQSLEEAVPGFSDQNLRLQDVVADPHTARPREAAEHADIARILHERLQQLDPVKQFVIAMRNDCGDAAALAARLFRDEASLSFSRGRTAAAAAAMSADLPARIRMIAGAEPALILLPAPSEELAIAV
jgi:RNA polymerase sigma factor (sigma-70 family)